MIKVIIPLLTIFLATQVIFSQLSWSTSGNIEPKPAAMVPVFKKGKKSANIFNVPAPGQTGHYTPQSHKLIGQSLYRLEFDNQNGVSLLGGNVADLVFGVTCLPLNLAAYEQLPNATIEVLINLMPTAIRATGLTAALRQIPAARIKAVEISTNFSDKPEVAGEAAIVILVTQAN